MKLSDKLTKAGESVSINRYDNGFMIEIGGKNADNDWSTAKIICGSLPELIELLTEYSEMERDE